MDYCRVSTLVHDDFVAFGAGAAEPQRVFMRPGGLAEVFDRVCNVQSFAETDLIRFIPHMWEEESPCRMPQPRM
jgi:hypothetical protein